MASDATQTVTGRPAPLSIPSAPAAGTIDPEHNRAVLLPEITATVPHQFNPIGDALQAQAAQARGQLDIPQSPELQAQLRAATGAEKPEDVDPNAFLNSRAFPPGVRGAVAKTLVAGLGSLAGVGTDALGMAGTGLRLATGDEPNVQHGLAHPGLGHRMEDLSEEGRQFLEHLTAGGGRAGVVGRTLGDLAKTYAEWETLAAPTRALLETRLGEGFVENMRRAATAEPRPFSAPQSLPFGDPAARSLLTSIEYEPGAQLQGAQQHNLAERDVPEDQRTGYLNAAIQQLLIDAGFPAALGTGGDLVASLKFAMGINPELANAVRKQPRWRDIASIVGAIHTAPVEVPKTVEPVKPPHEDVAHVPQPPDLHGFKMDVPEAKPNQGSKLGGELAAFGTDRIIKGEPILKALIAGTMGTAAYKAAQGILHGDGTDEEKQAGLMALATGLLAGKGAKERARLEGTRLPGEAPREFPSTAYAHGAAEAARLAPADTPIDPLTKLYAGPMPDRAQLKATLSPETGDRKAARQAFGDTWAQGVAIGNAASEDAARRTLSKMDPADRADLLIRSGVTPHPADLEAFRDRFHQGQAQQEVEQVAPSGTSGLVRGVAGGAAVAAGTLAWQQLSDKNKERAVQGLALAIPMIVAHAKEHPPAVGEVIHGGFPSGREAGELVKALASEGLRGEVRRNGEGKFDVIARNQPEPQREMVPVPAEGREPLRQVPKPSPLPLEGDVRYAEMGKTLSKVNGQYEIRQPGKQTVRLPGTSTPEQVREALGEPLPVGFAGTPHPAVAADEFIPEGIRAAPARPLIETPELRYAVRSIADGRVFSGTAIRTLLADAGIPIDAEHLTQGVTLGEGGAFLPEGEIARRYPGLTTEPLQLLRQAAERPRTFQYEDRTARTLLEPVPAEREIPARPEGPPARALADVPIAEDQSLGRTVAPRTPEQIAAGEVYHSRLGTVLENRGGETRTPAEWRQYLLAHPDVPKNEFDFALKAPLAGLPENTKLSAHEVDLLRQAEMIRRKAGPHDLAYYRHGQAGDADMGQSAAYIEEVRYARRERVRADYAAQLDRRKQLIDAFHAANAADLGGNISERSLNTTLKRYLQDRTDAQLRNLTDPTKGSARVGAKALVRTALGIPEGPAGERLVTNMTAALREMAAHERLIQDHPHRNQGYENDAARAEDTRIAEERAAAWRAAHPTATGQTPTPTVPVDTGSNPHAHVQANSADPDQRFAVQMQRHPHGFEGGAEMTGGHWPGRNLSMHSRVVHSELPHGEGKLTQLLEVQNDITQSANKRPLLDTFHSQAAAEAWALSDGRPGLQIRQSPDNPAEWQVRGTGRGFRETLSDNDPVRIAARQELEQLERKETAVSAEFVRAGRQYVRVDQRVGALTDALNAQVRAEQEARPAWRHWADLRAEAVTLANQYNDAVAHVTVLDRKVEAARLASQMRNPRGELVELTPDAAAAETRARADMETAKVERNRIYDEWTSKYAEVSEAGGVAARERPSPELQAKIDRVARVGEIAYEARGEVGRRLDALRVQIGETAGRAAGTVNPNGLPNLMNKETPDWVRTGVGHGLYEAAANGSDWFSWSTPASRVENAELNEGAAVRTYGPPGVESAIRDLWRWFGFDYQPGTPWGPRAPKGDFQYERIKLTPEMRDLILKVGIPAMGVALMAASSDEAKAQDRGAELAPGETAEPIHWWRDAAMVAGLSMVAVGVRHLLFKARAKQAVMGVEPLEPLPPPEGMKLGTGLPERLPPAPEITPAGRPGEPTVDQHFNVSKFNPADPTGEGVLRDQMQAIIDRDQLDPKVKVSWNETRAAAKDLGLGVNDIVEQPKLSRVEMLAIRDRVKGNVERIVELLHQREVAPAARVDAINHEVGVLEQHNAAYLAKFTKERATFGRDLNSLKILASSSKDPLVWEAKARDLMKLPAGSPLPETVRLKLAELLQHGTAQEVASYAASLRQATAGEKLIAVWKAGLMSGFRTQERNFVSNAVMAGAETVKDAPAALVDRVASLFSGMRSTDFSLLQTMRASAMGARKGIAEARLALKGISLDSGGGKVEVPQEINFRGPDDPTFWQAVKAGKPIAAGNALLDSYTKAVFRGMGAADRPWRQAAMFRSLAEQSRVLGREGLGQGTTPKERADWLFRHPTDEMSMRAMYDAEEAVFQNNNVAGIILTGARRGIMSLQGPPGARGLAAKVAGVGLETVVPFKRTPGAIAGKIVEYSPLGAVGSAHDFWRWANTVSTKGADREVVRDLQRRMAIRSGRWMTGSAAFALGMYWMRQGLVSGPPPSTPAERAQWASEGKQPFSIKLRGRWVQLPQIAGIYGNLIGAGAALAAPWMDNPDVKPYQGASRGAAGAARVLFDQPMMTGAKTLTRAVENPLSSGENFGTGLAGSVVPGAVSQFTPAFDEMRRDTRGDPLAAVEARVPGLSNRAPVARDVLGAPVEREPGMGRVGRTLLGATDFTGSTPDRTIGNPTLQSMSEVGAVAPPLARDPDETPGQWQWRQEVYGRLVRAGVEQTLQNPVYQQYQDALAGTSGRDRAVLTHRMRQEMEKNIHRLTSTLTRGLNAINDAEQLQHANP